MYKNKENDFTGLTEEVKRSREEHGSNKLPDPELTKWWEFALDALKEPITVILIVITTLITLTKNSDLLCHFSLDLRNTPEEVEKLTFFLLGNPTGKLVKGLSSIEIGLTWVVCSQVAKH